MAGVANLAGKLQQRLAARKHDERLFGSADEGTFPSVGNLLAQIPRRLELLAADKLGITESTFRRRSIFLSARPQVASRKAAEDGGSPDISAFALK